MTLEKTRIAYSDPNLVARYTELNTPDFNQTPLETFAKSLPGVRIIDVGCGPGHHAYFFSDLGMNVTGLDYSQKMITQAHNLRKVAKPPAFLVADMRDLSNLFLPNSFDGAWMAASLHHISEADTPQVLKGIKEIVANKGKIYIRIKSGLQGARVISESKYGAPIDLEYTFWEKENFQRVIDQIGFKTDEVLESQSGKTGDQPTTWLHFYLLIEK